MSDFFARHARVIVVLAVVCGSTSGALGKMITADSMVIGFYRLLFALPFFAAPVFLWHRQALRKIEKKDWFWCAAAGFFLFLHFFTWFSAVQRTEIASAIVLAALHPLVVLVVTIFIWKQQVNKKAVMGIVLALVGAAAVAGFDYHLSGDSFAGDVFAFTSAIFMGLYFCVGMKVRERVSAAPYVFLVYAFGAVFFVLGMLGTGTPFVGYPASDWLWMIVMALVCQVCAHAVFNWSLGYISSLYLSAWETAEIVFASLWAFLVFREIPSLWQFTGAAVVIGGLLWYNFNEGKQAEQEAPHEE